MSNEGYHEPVSKLSAGTRDMHRAIVSLMEELMEWLRRQEPTFDSEMRDYLFFDKPTVHK